MQVVGGQGKKKGRTRDVEEEKKTTENVSARHVKPTVGQLSYTKPVEADLLPLLLFDQRTKKDEWG